MPYDEPFTIVASAARTVNGTSSLRRPESGAANIAFHVSVTAATGTTPSLELSVEWSNNGTTWATPDGAADSFAAITTITEKVRSFPRKAKLHRLVWVITGTTPSFTFSVSEYLLG